VGLQNATLGMIRIYRFCLLITMSYSESASPQVKLVLEWVEGYKKKDLEILARPLHKDFRQIAYPRSLDKPEKNKEELLAYIAKVSSIWTETEASHFGYFSNPLRSS